MSESEYRQFVTATISLLQEIKNNPTPAKVENLLIDLQSLCFDQEVMTLDTVAAEIVHLKAECGRLGLFRTMQAMEAAVNEVGWELAARKEKELADDDASPP